MTLDDLDREDCFSLVMRGINSKRVTMIPDRGKIRRMSARLVDEGFAAVAEKDGVVVAYISALVTENPFYERFQMSIVGWFSEEPRAGWQLLRMAMEWKEEMPMIGSVVITTNPSARLQRILERKGWATMPSYLLC